jgi:hypothetical protein
VCRSLNNNSLVSLAAVQSSDLGSLSTLEIHSNPGIVGACTITPDRCGSGDACSTQSNCERWFGVLSPCCFGSRAACEVCFTNASAPRAGACATNCPWQCNASTCSLAIELNPNVTFRLALVADPDDPLSTPVRSVGSDVDGIENVNFTVGLPYRFQSPVNANTGAGRASYLANADNVTRITYQLNITSSNPTATNDILTSTSNGFVSIVPSAPYTAVVGLIATDGTDSVVLRQWQFTAHISDTTLNASHGPSGSDCLNGGRRFDGTRYDGAFSCDCSGTGHGGANCDVASGLPQLVLETTGQQYIPIGETASAFTFYNRSKWAWGQTYKLAPFQLTRAYTETPPAGQTHNTSFRLDWGRNAQPRGFFLEGSTGVVLIRIPQGVSLNLTARLLVEAPGTLPAMAATITFGMLPADVDNPSAVGPGGMACLNSGTKADTADGTTEFDLRYTCVCGSGFSGANCEVDLAAATAPTSDDSSSMVLYATVGVLLGVLVIGLAVGRYMVLRARRRPVDMAALQDEVLESLGMGGAFNIGHDEVGLAMTFGASMAREAVSAPTDLDETFGAQLLAMLLEQRGLPSRLTRMLKDPETRVTVDGTDGKALLRMKRPRVHQLKLGSEEAFAAVLQGRASARKLYIGGQRFVTDVAVAVPQRVPQELRCANERMAGVMCVCVRVFVLLSAPRAACIPLTPSRIALWQPAQSHATRGIG